MTEKIDIVIPVHFEGKSIIPTLAALKATVKHPHRILICYDSDDDSTLAFLNHGATTAMDVIPVKNRGRGVHLAVSTGFQFSRSPAVIMYPADDTANGDILDELIRQFEMGADIAVPSRFMKGGCMVGCPWLKAFLVRSAAATLFYFARIPVHDPTNGFRLFSRRVIDKIPLESTEGFTYSLEYLVKAHRLGWKIAEVPAKWFERKAGKSRFRVFGWAKAYLRWYWYAYATTFFGRGPLTVKLRSAPLPKSELDSLGLA